ncbi:hypothetical protein ACFQ68_02770 [Amycolatopsis japonica]|uniref:WXG100-like domain-containing protein n=1 Tax=Amycolatopsis japonica TaxID=208439 RepID=UPI0036709063
MQHFFKVVLGLEWPEGSEGGLRAIGHAWAQFSDVVEAVLGEVPAVSGRLDRSFDGVTASAILDVVRGDLTSGLEELRVRAAGFARQAKNAAADIQKAKVMLIVFAALTLAAIIQLLWTVFGAIFIPVVKAAARLTITAILQVLKTVLGQVTVRQAGQGLVKLSATVAQWAAGGAGLMVFVDFVIQGLQIATDGREGWDLEALKGAAIGGAIGGAAGGVFHGAATGAGRFLAKEFRHKLPRGWQKIFDIAGPSVYSVGQALMVVISNPFVFLATKDKDGVIWEGILGALAAPGGGKGNGVTGPGTTVLGQSFLDKLDQLGLGWLKPATTSLPAGGEKPGAEQLPPYNDKTGDVGEKRPLVIPEVVAAPVSARESGVRAARAIVSSAKRLLGTVFGPEPSASQVAPAESTGRSGLLDFLGGEEKTPAGAGSGKAEDARSSAAPVNQHTVGGSRGEATALAVDSRPSGEASVSPHSLSQADPRTESAAASQAQNPSHWRGPDAVGSQPQAESWASGEPPPAARIPDRQSTHSSPAAPPVRVTVTASGSTLPPDRTTLGSIADVPRSLQSAGESLGTTTPAKQTPGRGFAESSFPRHQSLVDGEGLLRQQTSAVKLAAPLSSLDDIGPQPASSTVTSDEPARPSPVITPQAPERPAATPGVGVPVPLSDVVGEIGLDEVDFVPLINAGRVVGAFFPLDQAEIEVVQSAFKAGAGKPGSYSLVGHGTGDGIWVRRKSGGAVVKLNASGAWRLLSSLLWQRGGARSDMPDAEIVSCWVDNPARGGFLGQMRLLARDDDFSGTLSGSKERARIRKDNPWIEELTGQPPGPFKGGVGFDENGVPYVDLATPEQQGWLDLLEQQEMSLWGNEEEQSMAGPSRLAGGGGTAFEDLVQVSPVERVPHLSGQVPDALLDAVVNGPVVASWRGELGAGLDGGWSEEAAAELAAFVEVFVRNSVSLEAEGREPLDVALVVWGVAGWQWITLLQTTLGDGLLEAGLNPDMVHSTFDWIGLGVADGEAPSVGVVVRESPNRQVGGYMGARTLPLSFLPGQAELTKASRRRLEWLAQGFVLRWVDRVTSWLLVEVSSAEKSAVEEELKTAVREAARLWELHESDEMATLFADIYVEFRVSGEMGAVLRIEGEENYLDSIQIEPDRSLTWHAQAPALPQEQPSRSAAKRKATESAAPPHNDTMRNPQKAQGTTLWLLNSSQTARRDAEVVDWWHVEPPVAGPPPALSAEDKKSMSEFADRLRQHKPEEGGVPWDIQVHVTETRQRLENYGPGWFDLVRNELKLALIGQGVHKNSDLLNFDFDYIRHKSDTKKKIRSSVDILVYDTTGQMIHAYQSAQTLELIFVRSREDLVASSRRKLHWRVEGMAGGGESDRGLLVFDLWSSEGLREGRGKSVTQEIEKAAQEAYRGKKSGEEIKKFINNRTALKCGSSKDMQGLFVKLIRESASVPGSLPDASGVVTERADGMTVPRAARREWQSQAAKVRKRVREKSAGDSGAKAAFNIPEAQVTTLWLLNESEVFRRDDAEVVDLWHMKPSESGPLVLLDGDKASMSDFADRLLRRKPVVGGVPWDIQFHLTVPGRRSEEYCQEAFNLLEEELKVALMGHESLENSDLLKFDFDHIKHHAGTKKNLPASVDILVYDITGQMIRYYQGAQKIELLFIPYREDLVASSRRKLHWRVEGMAGGGESDRGLLVFDLRSRDSLRKGRAKSVTQEIEKAARRVYQGKKSDEEIKNFINKRTALMHGPSKDAQRLFVKFRPESAGVSASSPEVSGEWQSQAAKARATPVQESDANTSFEVPEAQGTTLWLLNVSKITRRDATVVDRWHMKPPESGPLVLRPEDRKSMNEFADRLLRRKPEEGGVPWDAQVHVTETPERPEDDGREWFDMLKEQLRLALMGHGVDENSELLKFDFDYVEHDTDEKKGILPSVDILVYDTAGQMIQFYQNAQRLELIFLSSGVDLVASSRRKLHWRMQGIAAEGEGDQGLLVFNLHAKGNLREGQARSVTREIEKAVQLAYRGKKSDEEIKNFINRRTALRFRILKDAQWLFVELMQNPASVPTSLPDSSGVVAEQADNRIVSSKVRKVRKSQAAKAREKPAG